MSVSEAVTPQCPRLLRQGTRISRIDGEVINPARGIRKGDDADLRDPAKQILAIRLLDFGNRAIVASTETT
jgi:hypothetical protein